MAFIALLDGVLLFIVMRPSRLRQAFDFSNNAMADKPKGTPIWRLLRDPYIAICAGALAMVSKSLIIEIESVLSLSLFSGERRLGVSRADNFDLDARQNAGHRMANGNDLVTGIHSSREWRLSDCKIE